MLVVVRHVEGEAITDEASVEAELPFGCPLRTEVRVTKNTRIEGGLPTPAYTIVSPDRVKGARSPSGLSPCCTQFQLTVGAPEVLVGHNPGAAELRIELKTEVGTEGRVSVNPETGRDKVLVRDVEYVLSEEASVNYTLALLKSKLRTRSRDRWVTGAREVLTVCGCPLNVRGRALTTERKGGVDTAWQSEAVRAHVVERERFEPGTSVVEDSIRCTDEPKGTEVTVVLLCQVVTNRQPVGEVRTGAVRGCTACDELVDPRGDLLT